MEEPVVVDHDNSVGGHLSNRYIVFSVLIVCSTCHAHSYTDGELILEGTAFYTDGVHAFGPKAVLSLGIMLEDDWIP